MLCLHGPGRTDKIICKTFLPMHVYLLHYSYSVLGIVLNSSPSSLLTEYESIIISGILSSVPVIVCHNSEHFHLTPHSLTTQLSQFLIFCCHWLATVQLFRRGQAADQDQANADMAL